MTRWVECPYCIHKLFKTEESASGKIEIKCPSCKRIYELEIKEENEDDAGGSC